MTIQSWFLFFHCSREPCGAANKLCVYREHVAICWRQGGQRAVQAYVTQSMHRAFWCNRLGVILSCPLGVPPALIPKKTTQTTNPKTQKTNPQTRNNPKHSWLWNTLTVLLLAPSTLGTGMFLHEGSDRLCLCGNCMGCLVLTSLGLLFHYKMGINALLHLKSCCRSHRTNCSSTVS